MKKYPKYKFSKIDWIGDIPEHWDVKRLKYVATASPSNIDKKSKDYEETIFLCNYVDVYKNDFITDEIEFMKATASKAQIDKFTLKKGDIIATKDSESANDIGVAALVKQDFEDVVCGYHLTYIKPEKLVGEYLFRQFQSEYVKRKFETLANGVTRYALGVDAFNCLNLVLPPETEQIAIANYLDKKTEEIDNLIDEKKQLIQLLEEEKKNVISLGVRKGLNKNTELKESGIAWIGKIPKHWEIKKLKYLSKVQTGRTPKIQASNVDFFENGTINWFTPSDFKTNKEVFKSKRRITEEAILKNEVELFPEKSIYLVSIGATLGKISYCLTKASANQQINVISFNDKILNPIFGYYYLIGCKEILLLEADYTTLPILNQTKTKNLFLVVPPIEEQEKIVNHIELESKRIDFKIKKTNKLIDLLTEYRSALINEVVTGKVKITD